MTQPPSPPDTEPTAPAAEESGPEADRRPVAQQNPDEEVTPRHERREERARERLRTTEAERDELRRMLDQRDRAEAERLAAEVLINPADLWLLLGDEVAPLRDDAGQVSKERIAELLADKLDARPYLRRGTYGVAVNGETGPRGRSLPPPASGGWDKLLRR